MKHIILFSTFEIFIPSIKIFEFHNLYQILLWVVNFYLNFNFFSI
jgi:hypothetical protein